MALIGSLIGDPARAEMLSALFDGARTATELAKAAGVTPQTASFHLEKLLQGNLLAVEKQGRHRYYRLANPEIAALLENVIVLSALTGHGRSKPGPKDGPMRKARTCYDHLAGSLGTKLFDALLQQRILTAGDSGFAISDHGWKIFKRMGLDMQSLQSGRRPHCRACLDWSERRPHLAGALGAILLEYFLYCEWVKKTPHSRVLEITHKGERAFASLFKGRWPQKA